MLENEKNNPLQDILSSLSLFTEMGPYDLLSRQMVTELNAVVVSVE